MKPDIEKMIAIGQPILVMESNGMLAPPYLAEPSSDGAEKFMKNRRDWVTSLLVPFDYPAFDARDFIKKHQDRINHLGVTMNVSDLLNGKIDVENVDSVYTFVQNLFYFAPQSDAGHLRQRLGRPESTLVLYQPFLVEITDGTQDSESGIMLRDKKTKLQPQLDLYLKK